MTNMLQQRALKIRLRAASAALTFAVALVFAGVTAPSAQAQKFTDLYNFTGAKDGGTPGAGVIRDAKGNLYGTTVWNGSVGWGTVFKLDAKGVETVLYNFTGKADGANPSAGLIRDSNGNLYGTTVYGGNSLQQGTVFRVAPNGTETVYAFAGGATDGCYPYQGLVRDKAGNFYGTTSACGTAGKGVVFELSPQGKETVLHNFAGGSSDGQSPFYGSLLIDTLGNLYGVTQGGRDVRSRSGVQGEQERV